MVEVKDNKAEGKVQGTTQNATENKSDKGSGSTSDGSSNNSPRGENRADNRGDNREFRGRKNFFKNKNFIYQKKECYITKNRIKYIDFKDVGLLKRFVKKSGQIISNRITGATNINQRKIVKAIKRARFMGLLPFRGNVEDPIFPNFNNRKRPTNRPGTVGANASTATANTNENKVVDKEKVTDEAVVENSTNVNEAADTATDAVTETATETVQATASNEAEVKETKEEKGEQSDG